MLITHHFEIPCYVQGFKKLLCIYKQGDLLQPLLQIFLQFNDSPIELLEELASNVMPQVGQHSISQNKTCMTV